MRRILSAALVLTAALTFARCAGAEDGFRVRVDAPQLTAARRAAAARAAERHLRELETFFRHRMSGPVTVHLAATDKDFARLAPGLPSWAVGAAERRKVFIAPKILDDPAFEATLRHELAHVLLIHLFRNHPGAPPRWLDEGLAMRASESWEFSDRWPDRRTELAGALRTGVLPDFSSLERDFPISDWLAQLAYAQSYDFTRFLEKRLGERKLIQWLHAAAASGDIAGEYRELSNENLSQAEIAWRAGTSENVIVSVVRTFATQTDSLLWGLLPLLLIVAYVRYRLKRPQYYHFESNVFPFPDKRRRRRPPPDDDDYPPWEDEYD